MSARHRFVTDDHGRDLVEYALLGAFIALSSLVVAQVFPGVMSAVYLSWQAATNGLWYPQAPAN